MSGDALANSRLKIVKSALFVEQIGDFQKLWIVIARNGRPARFTREAAA